MGLLEVVSNKKMISESCEYGEVEIDDEVRYDTKTMFAFGVTNGVSNVQLH